MNTTPLIDRGEIREGEEQRCLDQKPLEKRHLKPRIGAGLHVLDIDLDEDSELPHTEQSILRYLCTPAIQMDMTRLPSAAMTIRRAAVLLRTSKSSLRSAVHLNALKKRFLKRLSQSSGSVPAERHGLLPAVPTRRPFVHTLPWPVRKTYHKRGPQSTFYSGKQLVIHLRVRKTREITHKVGTARAITCATTRVVSVYGEE